MKPIFCDSLVDNMLRETQIGGSSGMQNWNVTFKEISKPQHV